MKDVSGSSELPFLKCQIPSQSVGDGVWGGAGGRTSSDGPFLSLSEPADLGNSGWEGARPKDKAPESLGPS